VHFFLVAHTTKILKGKDGKYEVPNLYSISGSANFFNKTHNGITIL
jgi:twinkle protein